MNIHCKKCNNLLTIYQKDGVGMLKRLYLDRIFSEINENNFNCNNCNEKIGILITYKKENRKALRLFQGAISKSIYGENKK